MSTIQEELRTATVFPGTRPGTSAYLSPAIHAKVLTFAVEHGLGDLSNAEGAAMAVILQRYFKMIEDDRWSTWLAEQES